MIKITKAVTNLQFLHIEKHHLTTNQVHTSNSKNQRTSLIHFNTMNHFF
jgi:hypothetical protein